MPMKRATIISVFFYAAFVTGLTTSCGKKAESVENQAEAAAQAAQQMANNVTNTANGSNATHKSATHAIASNTLSGFLPSVNGFTAHEPSTSSANFNGVEWSTAEREFENGEKHIKVTLADYNYAEGLTAAYSMLMNFSMENENEIQHGEKFGSNPGWVNWHKKNNDGQIGVIVNDRIYLIVEGSGGVTLDELRSVVNQVNTDAIAKASAANS
jgi:hypothetical protein